ncbi:hypothetical protein BTA51_19145 [Hahella sp. CCB-MM4]|uniref:putative adhesin n=1 Tax=Hahella sp. (strain CCB-MM4) TaxID=1926491 RepID=UPI000B9C7563|nr:hypothetical protein [Hahella sp. CCB-MM4]OZG71757.1 hypothetical protein BTA51_19145 [Hahella sp. CCB-MM4]
MSMSKASNQKALGDYLYLFESKAGNSSECLILGHAGWVESLGDYFRVPSGVELNFRVMHSLPNTTNPVAELGKGATRYDRNEQLFTKQAKAARMMLDDFDKRQFSGGSLCKNYVVVKGLGYHWDKKNADNWSYKQMEKFMTSSIWKPHIASVRNRNSKKYLLLSEIIDLVRQDKPNVNKFIFAGCRGVHPDWKP